MFTRKELRERMAKLGIGASVLGAYAGVVPSDISAFLSGREEQIPDISFYRVHDTLIACEKLAAEVDVPIRWSDVMEVRPRLTKYLQTLSERRLAETNKAELQQMQNV